MIALISFCLTTIPILKIEDNYNKLIKVSDYKYFQLLLIMKNI